MECGIELVKDLGFPIFVAVFVLVRLEPAIKRLERSITTHMIVTAKANGMKAKDVQEIVKLVTRNGKKRRAADRVEFPDGDK